MKIPVGIDRKRVVIAGDDPVFTTYLSILLNRLGLDIIPVTSPAETQEMIHVARPDIILLVSIQPSTPWLRLLRQMKKQQTTRFTPVIAIIDESAKAKRDSYFKLGCAGVLTKPVEVAELNTLLWNVIVLPEGRRRRTLRVAYDRKISLSYHGKTEYHYAVSLSEGGIQIRQKRPLIMGTLVEATISLADGSPLRLKGMVIDKIGIYDSLFPGVRGITIGFRELTADDTLRLRGTIARILAGDILEEQEEPYLTADAYLVESPSEGLPTPQTQIGG